MNRLPHFITQSKSGFTCSKLAIETAEKVVKYVQSYISIIQVPAGIHGLVYDELTRSVMMNPFSFFYLVFFSKENCI